MGILLTLGVLCGLLGLSLVAVAGGSEVHHRRTHQLLLGQAAYMVGMVAIVVAA